MSNQHFTFAGVSTRKGVTKARFSNRDSYVKALIKVGDTNIDLVNLPHAMSKVDAIAYLISINFDNGNTVVRAALEEGLSKRQDRQTVATDDTVAA